MKKFLLLFLVAFAFVGLTACQEEETVVTVESIQIVTAATKTDYNVGESIDLAGLEVKANMSNGTEQTLTVADLTVTGFDNTTTGLQTITLTYESKTVTFQINMFDPEGERTLSNIVVTELPDKQVYAVGEAFVEDGLVVQAVYSNGDREFVTTYTLSGFDSTAVNAAGQITVTFEDATAVVPYKIQAILVQGVTETTITVGNTAATSGYFAVVGIPFNAGIQAYFAQVNANGGVLGRQLQFVTYDDGFSAVNGLNYTKQLVEEDEIFALVGHFGTPTVGATVEYIQQVGVPMVYAATGINALYFEQSLGNPVMAVQPIYKTDGRIMTARALNESLYGAAGDQKLSSNAKVGVLHTTTDDGLSIKAGIEIQALTEGREDDFIYRSFSASNAATLNSAVLDFISNGVQAVIIASNQAPFKAAVGALNSNGLDVPVFTSYVNADATSVDPSVSYGFNIYANAWIDIVDPEGQSGFSADYWEFATVMTNNGYPEYAANAYAMAGYIAAHMFVEGLSRVEGALTWETFIKAMESAPVNIPMGGAADFTGGKRWGVTSMALVQLDLSTGTPAWGKVRPLEDIQVIQDK